MPNWIDEQVQKQRFEDIVRTAQRDHVMGIGGAVVGVVVLMVGAGLSILSSETTSNSL